MSEAHEHVVQVLDAGMNPKSSFTAAECFTVCTDETTGDGLDLGCIRYVSSLNGVDKCTCIRRSAPGVTATTSHLVCWVPGMGSTSYAYQYSSQPPLCSSLTLASAVTYPSCPGDAVGTCPTGWDFSDVSGSDKVRSRRPQRAPAHPRP